MKNPAPYVRNVLVTLLNNQITYGGQQVPCYEGEGETIPYQILIREQSIGAPKDKHTMSGRFEQVIEVISEQQTNLRKHVDAIGEQVMDLIKPTALSQGFYGNTDFQVCTIKKISQNYLDEPSGDGSYINRLIIRLQFLIIEK